MPKRERSLDDLQVGDFFHALCPNGASLIGLITSVTDVVIHARRVTTQEDLVFDRRTGVTLQGPGLTPCTLNSVAPFPDDVREAMLGLDRRYRHGQDPERFKLTEAERKALLFIVDNYATERP